MLSGTLTSARIAPMRIFTVADWIDQPQSCLTDLEGDIGQGPLIVRSSCLREDGSTDSQAGRFLSLLHVEAQDVELSVSRVIESYGHAAPCDEVLIQPMLQNVIYSGVAFSHDPSTCSPYRVVNWAEGKNTTTVTGGRGSGRSWRQAALGSVPPPPQAGPVLKLLEELLELFDGLPLDVEFAITEEGGEEVLWLLQARQLHVREAPESPLQQSSRITLIQRKVSRGMEPHPFLMGKRTIYAVMPDWNPAEIIGIRPKPLALSLYKELITDSIWAYQRNNYGYRNLRSFPLMPHFFGQPYIDVRLSFNSFVPASLSPRIANRLVDHYIDQLLARPTLHDKVEFEIVFSCYTLDLPQRLETLSKSGFSKQDQDEIADSLKRLTNRIINPRDGLWRADAARLEMLTTRRDQLLASSSDPIERIYWLIEDGKRYGTLPFAGLARAGFIAVQMLQSLVSVGVLSPSGYADFMGGISTVGGQMARDRSNLDRATFLARYGHLRPGTYEITSLRYDEADDFYFDWGRQPVSPASPIKAPSFSLPQMREITQLLSEHELQPDAFGLLDFIQTAIELREWAKFQFSRNLSDALSLIAQVGGLYGLTREELAYSDWACWKELYSSAGEPEAVLTRSIEQGAARYQDTLKVALPPMISEPDDVWAFEVPETEPNFIGMKNVIGDVTTLESKADLAGAVVCIPNADPGFDWIFGYPIAGLITAWGGLNSHMAIRAGELGIPAVIGAGESLYGSWSAARRIHIDCANRRVEVLA